ncbi:MAG: HWE histidine kinase domain-containing protein, partial [Xanthobacteraceae bacterium]
HVTERTAELEASNMQLKQAEQGRSLALAAGQMGSWDWDLVSKQWRWDEGQHRIFGVDPAHFQITVENIRALIRPEDWISLVEIARGMSRGARTQQTEFRVVRPNGEIRWCIGTAAASVNDDGNVVRINGVTIDITDRKEADERQVLLAREVDHRARNALAVIQSIIRLTQANSVDDYVEAIEGRIKALSRAHTLLSASRWNSADLGTLVGEELAPYSAGDKITFEGPDISLQPATAQGLALALHELATNAAKHGALSSNRGKVSLKWELAPDALQLHWLENGGPRITAPSARSFGLRVIVASIEQQLGGKLTFDWDARGLRCTMWIPRSELLKSRAFHCVRPAVDGNGVAIGFKRQDQPRVLLVEDEALVAMMIQETLGELGFQIVGPVSTASEALSWARENHFDAAVLDINLGDGLVYTVAEVLEQRGVPFVFVTGYDVDSIDSRFTAIPILQKPIEREMLQRIFVQGATSNRAVAV